MATCEKFALPDLMTPTDSRTQPAVVGPRGTIRFTYERRTVYVMEPTSNPSSHPRNAGVFTSKCVDPRVIAAGLDANMCNVQRRAYHDPASRHGALKMTIRDTLKKMQ